MGQSCSSRVFLENSVLQNTDMIPWSLTKPFPVLLCLTPHPHSLCFLRGKSDILQWWKDSLIILHTKKKMVIVFHFTWKLMDLGIPDVDVQNPLWSLSGDLSSLGCLWRTPVSAEVTCELFHTKSRFLREEVHAHTYTHTHAYTQPLHPLSCTVPGGPAPMHSDLRRNFLSQGLGGFRVEKDRERRGPAEGSRALHHTGFVLLFQAPGEDLWVLLLSVRCWDRPRQPAGRTHGLSSLGAARLCGTGLPARGPLCQVLGFHIKWFNWARKDAYRRWSFHWDETNFI